MSLSNSRHSTSPTLQDTQQTTERKQEKQTSLDKRKKANGVTPFIPEGLLPSHSYTTNKILNLCTSKIRQKLSIDKCTNGWSSNTQEKKSQKVWGPRTGQMMLRNRTMTHSLLTCTARQVRVAWGLACRFYCACAPPNPHASTHVLRDTFPITRQSQVPRSLNRHKLTHYMFKLLYKLM